MHRNERHAPHLWALFALLVSAYLLAYSGAIESGDSRSLFNVTASLFRYGDTLMDLNADQQPPSLPLLQPHSLYPLRAPDIEPMQSLAALPLYALADVIPGIGLAQTTWTFNILVTAATACALFGLGRMLGFSSRAALAAALAFGLCSAAVPYSKTFFREPLSALTVLLAFVFAEKSRSRHYALGWVAVLAGGVALMLLTRAAAVFALPALLVVLLPSLRNKQASRSLVIALVVALVAGLVFLIGGQLDGGRYDIINRLIGDRAYFEMAIFSYLTSIGGSIWGTSPVLLLSIPGCVLLWRRGHWRYALALPLVVLTFAIGYASYADAHWFGGLSWPPRFLIATIPVLVIGTLPYAEIATSRQKWLGPGALVRVLFLLLCAYGLWIQLTAVSLRWQDYLLGLPPESLGTLEWQPGLTQFEFLRWIIIPQLWERVPLDLAWVRANVPLWAAAGALLLSACTLWLAWGVWRTPNAGRWSACLVIGVAAYGFVGLRLFHDRDPYYRAADNALHALVAQIDAETVSGDVVLLSNPAYVTFFMNYGKLHDAGRIISLPDQPGDRPSPEQAPRVSSDNPELLVRKESIPLIQALTESRERLWLVENFGPALPWSTRPVERYLATYFYPIRTLEVSAQVRLIEFATTLAPDPYGVYTPEHSSDLLFANNIRLVGVDLPDGTIYHPGETIALSLVWEAEQVPEQDYIIGVYLRASDGSAVVQTDSPPAWGFAPTSGWRQNIPIWDNRALRLPETLQPGDYQVWIKVYGFDTTFNVVDLPVTGQATLDSVIGILGERITVR